MPTSRQRKPSAALRATPERLTVEERLRIVTGRLALLAAMFETCSATHYRLAQKASQRKRALPSPKSASPHRRNSRSFAPRYRSVRSIWSRGSDSRDVVQQTARASCCPRPPAKRASRRVTPSPGRRRTSPIVKPRIPTSARASPRTASRVTDSTRRRETVPTTDGGHPSCSRQDALRGLRSL